MNICTRLILFEFAAIERNRARYSATHKHPFTHLYTFTCPSCLWTSWSTCLSLCPSCLYSICNMKTIHIHGISSVICGRGPFKSKTPKNKNAYFKAKNINESSGQIIVNKSSSYIATFLRRLLMSLSKGFFAWAVMRQPWALSYSCSSKYAWQRWHQSE